MRHAAATLVSATLFIGAGQAPQPPPPAPAAGAAPVVARPAVAPSFVNRVWQTTPPAGAPPQYYVFLAEGTLIIASSTGTPMVGRWSRAGEGLRMVEEGRDYHTDIVSLSADALHLRSHNPGTPVDLHLVPATPAPPAMLTTTGRTSTASTVTSVTGTVAYRERMALPPDAAIEVWVTDTSPGVVTMAVIAQITLAADGRQVPIAFTLPIDPARLDPSRSYGLRAVIKSGGQVLFQTPEPVSVLTGGQPATVSLILVRAPI